MDYFGRKFTLAFLAAFGTMYATLFAFMEVLDPSYENIWRPSWSPRLSEDILTARVLKHKLSQGPRVVVFGTSRSAMISGDLMGEPILNMYSIYGNPEAVRDFLYRLTPGEIRYLKKVYYLIDAQTLCRNCFIDRTDYTSFKSVVAFKIADLPHKIGIIRVTIAKLLRNELLSVVDEDGAVIPSIAVGPDDGGWENSIPHPVLPLRDVDREVISILADIDSFVKSNGIEVVYFTPPLPRKTLANMDMAKLASIKQEIMLYLGSINDLTNIDGISDKPYLFADETHLNRRGAMVALCALSSGRFVTTGGEGQFASGAMEPPESNILPDECR